MFGGQDHGMADITKEKSRLGCAYHDYLASFMSVMYIRTAQVN
jgi:hypothetical protein